MRAGRGGDTGVGEWQWEVRNYVKDFKTIVREDPTQLKFIAVMIDGDNTNSNGTAYFGPIELWSELPPRFQGKVGGPPRRYEPSRNSRTSKASGRTAAGMDNREPSTKEARKGAIGAAEMSRDREEGVSIIKH